MKNEPFILVLLKAFSVPFIAPIAIVVLIVCGIGILLFRPY
jgi:hypothetical protein